MTRTIGRLGLLALLASGAACGPATRPPVVTPPPAPDVRRASVTVVTPDRQMVPGLSCTLIVDTLDPIACSYQDFRAVFTIPAAKWCFGATLHLAADGFTPDDTSRFTICDPELGASALDSGGILGERILTPKPTFRARRGVVHAVGRVFVDDDGPFLAVGASCMWCAWGFEHDLARTRANLACAAGRTPDRAGCPKHGVDYVRVLGVVGPTSWSDRTVDGRSGSLEATFAGLTDLAYKDFGLRVQWSIFGGIETTPNAADRAALVQTFVAMARGREQEIMAWEVANEGPLNGFGGESGKAELWRLAGMLRAGTPNLVALTSPQGEDNPRAWYDGSPANLWTAHLDRSINGTGGMFRPIRQARDMIDQPLAWTSNEPIGIDSSVAADADPTRLTLAAIYTWLCRGGAYVIHTGAGIRGGGVEDLNRGRKANLWEQTTFAATVDGIAAIRAVLPADLPGFPRWENGNANFGGYPFDTDPIQNEDNVLRAFCAIAIDARIVCVPIQVQRPTPFKARQAMSFDVIDPFTGAIRTHVDLAVGQTYTQPPADGAVFLGHLR